MEDKYICYCGLYCENCAVKAKVEPSAKVLHEEMLQAGFEDIIHFIPDGEAFWRFLTTISKQGSCISCQDGSGNPACRVRICAKEKGVELCALCDSYPCEIFGKYLEAYPMLEDDNAFFKENGRGEWMAMQAKRRAGGFTYTDEINNRK